MTTRRTLLVRAVAAAGGAAGLAFGSGAFTQVEADRNVTIGIDSDDQALLALVANEDVASVYEDDESGELVIDTEELSDGNEGFNVGSTVQIGQTTDETFGDEVSDSDYAFKVVNNFDDGSDGDFEPELDVAIDLTDFAPDENDATLEFVTTRDDGSTDPDSPTVTGGERLVFDEVASEEKIYVAIRIETDSPGTDPDDLDGDVVFQAGSDLSDDFPTEVTGELIEDWHDLADISDEPDEEYVLVNDLDEDTAGYGDVVDSGGFDPLPSFGGEFDGQGNTIADLELASTGEDLAGLFSSVGGGAVIENIRFVDSTFEGKLDGDFNNVGILTGSAFQQPTVSDIEITGADITIEENSSSYEIGTLVGLVSDAAGEDDADFTFENIEITDTSITSNATPSRQDQGGLIGTMQATADSEAKVSNVFVSGTIDAKGSVSTGGLIGTIDLPVGGNPDRTIENVGTAVDIEITNYDGQNSPQGIGGLVGLFEEADISDAYAIGDVDVDGGSIGGALGDTKPGTAERIFAAGDVNDEASNDGGLVGRLEDTTLTDSNWDTDATEQAAGVGDQNNGTFEAEGLDTDEAQGEDADENFDEAFDFENTWETVAGDYPILQALDESTQLDARD